MSKIERFEDLECWKAARELVNKVFEVCNKEPLKSDFETKGQLKKAALSSMNNIAEGFSRYHKKDSLKFYDYAQSSAAEVKSMTYVLTDNNYLPDNDIEDLFQKSEKTRKLTLGFIRYLEKK